MLFRGFLHFSYFIFTLIWVVHNVLHDSFLSYLWKIVLIHESNHPKNDEFWVLLASCHRTVLTWHEVTESYRMVPKGILDTIYVVPSALLPFVTANLPSKPTITRGHTSDLWPDLWQHKCHRFTQSQISDSISKNITKVHSQGYQMFLDWKSIQ